MFSTIYDELFNLNREMNRIFRDQGYSSRYYPQTNIYENQDEYIIVAKMSGVPKEQLSITLKDNTLTISGDRKKEQHEKAVHHLAERYHGKFERSFMINEKIDADSINADLNNGLLMLKLSKSAETKPKKIEIQ